MRATLQRLADAINVAGEVAAGIYELRFVGNSLASGGRPRTEVRVQRPGVNVKILE